MGIYDRFFLFVRLNLPNVLISIGKKKKKDSDFPSPCFDVPKASNFTSGRLKPWDQKQETRNDCEVISGLKQISPTFSHFLRNNELLYYILANWLAHNMKMTQKSVFREAWSPEMTSQSFPVSWLWSGGFVPHRKWNLTLLVHQNTGKENRCRKFFFAIHTVHWGDLIEQTSNNQRLENAGEDFFCSFED